MSNPAIVLEISQASQWKASHGGKHVPAPRHPTVLHPSREAAEQAAMRLASGHANGVFAVLEVVSVAKAIKVPTHITLNGKVVAEQPLTRLMQVSDPGEEIPF
jgi:undecaprenyl pyrophosphate synthase